MSSFNGNSYRWIVTQEGSRQTYAVPVALHREGLLRMFYTDIWCRWGRSILSRGTKGTRALATRFHPELPSNRVISFGGAAIATRSLDHFRRMRLSRAQLVDVYCRFGEWFAGNVRDRIQKIELDGGRDFFFGFNTNCLEVLEFLRGQGVFLVVDQVDPGRVEEEIILHETERWPGWAKAPGQTPQGYWDRLEAEWSLADLVLVNSEWSADALVQQGVAREKIIVVPLAIDTSKNFQRKPAESEGSLKVLWLGSVILRKGIQYLVQAAKLLKNQNIEFLVAGPIGVSEEAVRSFPSNMKMMGRITRDRLGEIYQQAHVFVLPTVSDGFGVTQLEAMAHGLPVVATPNCGRVVTDGMDGFIVPPRDGLALADALARLNCNRHLLREMSSQALLTVQKYQLPAYARTIHDLAVVRRRASRQKPSLSHV